MIIMIAPIITIRMRIIQQRLIFPSRWPSSMIPRSQARAIPLGRQITRVTGALQIRLSWLLPAMINHSSGHGRRVWNLLDATRESAMFANHRATIMQREEINQVQQLVLELSIMHYFFNALSFALPIILLMSNGILFHYRLLFWWVMKFESNTHYFFNKQWNSRPPNIFLKTNGIRIFHNTFIILS